MEKAQLITLVKKAQAGDLGATEELLQYAHTSVSYQCRKMLRNEQDAQDMTQEVLLTIYTKLYTLQDPAAFRSWANQIAATRCVNALTRAHVEFQFSEDEDGHSILDQLEELDEQVIPDKAIDNAETARMIEEIVSGLPDAQRAATLLYYYNEMSVKQIAQLMDVSENTVKSRLNYARKAIKEKVLDYEKQGIKLYGLSPLPFLLYFLRFAAQNSADKKAAAATVSKVMASASTHAGIAAITTQGAAAAGTAASGFFSGVAAKVVAGILASTVLAGGVIAVIHSGNQDKSAVADSAVEETFKPEMIDDHNYTPPQMPEADVTAEPSEPEATEAQTVTEPNVEESAAPPDATAPEVTEPSGPEPVESEPEATLPPVSEVPSEEASNPGVHECDYVVTEYVPHTCTSGGWTTATCTICGDTVTQYRTALWHNYVDGVCTICGGTQDTCQHLYDSGVEYWPAGTMTWEPYTLYTCTICGHTYTELIDYLS